MNLEEVALFKLMENTIGITELIYLLESEFNIKYEDINRFKLDPYLENYIDKIKVLVRRESNKLEIITDTPFNKNIEEIFKNQNIEIYYCTTDDINKKIELNSNSKIINSRPIESVVENIINIGLINRSSDIHLEIYGEKFRIRYRVDGILLEKYKFNKEDYNKINNRIKILGKMDISNKLIPQDGHFNWIYNDLEYDIRVSTVPTIYGEKIVLRLLMNNFLDNDMEDLGMNEDTIIKVKNMINKINGMLILTGPTGSGKTTTMYSILKSINVDGKNIVTIEDPIEYKINGINQIQINNKAGLTFSNGLRAILRQDPDIIMIGEIRDSETAKLAIRSSITGHLVLSTLHTNNTHSAIVRLLDLGVENYLISDGVTAIMSQRLIRKLCNFCKESYDTDEFINQRLGFKGRVKIYRARGCERCNDGYLGRLGVYEVLEIDRFIVNQIKIGKDIEEIRNNDIKNGFKSIESNMIELLLNGVVSYEDIIKIGFYR